MLTFRQYMKESTDEYAKQLQDQLHSDDDSFEKLHKQISDDPSITTQHAKEIHNKFWGFSTNFKNKTDYMNDIMHRREKLLLSRRMSATIGAVAPTIPKEEPKKKSGLFSRLFRVTESVVNVDFKNKRVLDTNESVIQEANHPPVTLYDDNAPPPDDKISITPDKVHKWVRKHQANLYTLAHLQKHVGPDKPNLKIHYTNQMAIASRKRDYWLNAKIPGSGGAHYYDRSKSMQDTHHARNMSNQHLTDLGYTDLQAPPKMKEDPKVAAMPRTADGRIQFGVTKK